MKNGLALLVCALSLLAFASTAQSGGGEASGTFTFDLGTATGTVSLSGELDDEGGAASGQISFHASVNVSGETCQPVNVGTVENPILVDVCEPNGNTQPTSVALDLLIDSMVIADNRAAMSGTIVGNSPFAGQHTILAVEDGGGNDGFTWGVYKTKVVNTLATDFDFCQGPPDPGVCEGEFCPTPTCFFDGKIIDDQSFPSYTLTYIASDYELCPYPPPTITGNFLGPISEGNAGGDPHNYTCYTGAPDPNGHPAGIPVLATQTITNSESFPLFTYPMTPIPHGGGNKVNVKKGK